MTRLIAADAPGIAEAVQALLQGRLVAFPTETVYGLGAIATDDRAIAGIYAAKGRPAGNPLILHLAEPKAAEGFARFDARARALADAFWPGPLTMVLPLLPEGRAGLRVSPLATAGLDSVAIRVPAHKVALALLKAVALPVAAPSANRSGQVSPTEAAHVMADLAGRVDLVLDAGPVAVGIESTVLDLTRPASARILRPGGLTRAAIEAVLGPLDDGAPAGDGPLRSPGLLARHYAPKTPLRLDATSVEPGEALLAFGPRPLEGAAHTLNLSETGDLDEAARNLYAMLRTLDALGARRIAVMRLPGDGLGEALADRLRRAATP